VLLLRNSYREVAAALELTRTSVKRSDDFDPGAFLSFVRARLSVLDGASDPDVRELLARLQDVERRRVAALGRG
jgi:hypothetical protein